MVEDAAFGQTHVAQALFDAVLIEGLDAVGFNGGHGRTFDHVDDKHRAVDGQVNVAEQPRGVELVNGFGAALGVVFVADAKRQMRENRTGLSTLNAFDADVGDGEDLSGGRGGHQSRHGSCQDCFEERSRHVFFWYGLSMRAQNRSRRPWRAESAMGSLKLPRKFTSRRTFREGVFPIRCFRHSLRLMKTRFPQHSTWVYP